VESAERARTATLGLRLSIMQESGGRLPNLIGGSTSVLWVNRANSILPVQDGNDICLSGGWDMNGDALYWRRSPAGRAGSDAIKRGTIDVDMQVDRLSTIPQTTSISLTITR